MNKKMRLGDANKVANMKTKKQVWAVEHNSFGDEIITYVNIPTYTPGGMEVNHEGSWRNVKTGDIVKGA